MTPTLLRLRSTVNPNKKTYGFTLFWLFLAFPGIAQELNWSEDSDTSSWYAYQNELLAELGVSSIPNSTETLELRFSDPFKLIRVWQVDTVWRGKVYFFLREYIPNEEQREGRLYHSNTDLNEESITYFVNMWKDFEIEEIPSRSHIPGWNYGFHGVLYHFSYKYGMQTSFKSYWSPHAFPRLKEARFIEYFARGISRLKFIEKNYENFMKHQPFEQYFVGIGSAMIHTNYKD